MPDLYEPIATQQTAGSALQALSDYMVDLLALTDLKVILYQNNVVPSPTMDISALVEADFGGYTRQTVAALSGPFLDSSNQAYSQTALLTFTADGSSANSIYGAALVGTPAGATPATATNPGNAGAYDPAFVITAGGGGYQTVPKVRLTGATGSGATAHAVLTAGMVTDIVLDTPGSAYTTFTVDIDPPLELIQLSQLSNSGIAMALTTDALPTYIQLTQPSVGLVNP